MFSKRQRLMHDFYVRWNLSTHMLGAAWSCMAFAFVQCTPCSFLPKHFSLPSNSVAVALFSSAVSHTMLISWRVFHDALWFAIVVCMKCVSLWVCVLLLFWFRKIYSWPNECATLLVLRSTCNRQRQAHGRFFFFSRRIENTGRESM